METPTTDGVPTSSSQISSVGGGCPVKHNAGGNSSTSSSNGSVGGWRSWLGIGSAAAAAATTTASATNNNASTANTPVPTNSSGGCPVKHGNNTTTTSTSSSSFNLPPSLEEAAHHPQSPQPDQKLPLSTYRVISTIPRADELRPDPEPQPTKPSTTPNTCEDNAKHAPHQPADNAHWVYPSEQQFYNAMRRKGWEASETTIPTVVRIHNAVNERGWSEIKRWEYELHGCANPRLVRFLGRPNDTSPKAWINSNLLFYRAPFDRHDWFVDRGDGKEPRRYVIDFYDGESGGAESEKKSGGSGGGKKNGLPSMYLDVRPALDDGEAFVDRAKMFLRDAFPGIVGAFESGVGDKGTSSSGEKK